MGTAYADYLYNSYVCSIQSRDTCADATDASCKIVCYGYYDACVSVDNSNIDFTSYISDLLDASCPASGYFSYFYTDSSTSQFPHDGECTTTTSIETTTIETTTTIPTTSKPRCDRHGDKDDCNGDLECFWSPETSSSCVEVSDTVPSCGEDCSGSCQSLIISGTYEPTESLTESENVFMEYFHEVQAACHAETTQAACEAVASDVVDVPDGLKVLSGTDRVSVRASCLLSFQ